MKDSRDEQNALHLNLAIHDQVIMINVLSFLSGNVHDMLSLSRVCWWFYNYLYLKSARADSNKDFFKLFAPKWGFFQTYHSYGFQLHEGIERLKKGINEVDKLYCKLKLIPYPNLKSVAKPSSEDENSRDKDKSSPCDSSFEFALRFCRSLCGAIILSIIVVGFYYFIFDGEVIDNTDETSKQNIAMLALFGGFIFSLCSLFYCVYISAEFSAGVIFLRNTKAVGQYYSQLKSEIKSFKEIHKGEIDSLLTKSAINKILKCFKNAHDNDYVSNEVVNNVSSSWKKCKQEGIILLKGVKDKIFGQNGEVLSGAEVQSIKTWLSKLDEVFPSHDDVIIEIKEPLSPTEKTPLIMS